jgi:hypothetical protein
MPKVSSLAAQSNDQPAQSLTKLLYDRKSAAFVLSVSLRSLDYLVANKLLNTLKLGSKVMFGHGELVRFSRSNHLTLTANPESL